MDLLLSDVVYALKIWLMSPLLIPQTASEKSNPYSNLSNKIHIILRKQ